MGLLKLLDSGRAWGWSGEKVVEALGRMYLVEPNNYLVLAFRTFIHSWGHCNFPGYPESSQLLSQAISYLVYVGFMLQRTLNHLHALHHFGIASKSINRITF